MTKFTAAQRRALLALPADGSWLPSTRNISPALDSLNLYHRELVDYMWTVTSRQFRLTPAGIAARKALEETP